MLIFLNLDLTTSILETYIRDLFVRTMGIGCWKKRNFHFLGLRQWGMVPKSEAKPLIKVGAFFLFVSKLSLSHCACCRIAISDNGHLLLNCLAKEADSSDGN